MIKPILEEYVFGVEEQSEDDTEECPFEKFVKECGFDGFIAIDGINKGDSK
jgi:hypothetical protein